MPWGAPLPAIQFSTLGAKPAFIHTLVGDDVWQACWGPKQGSVADEHYVPYKLLNTVKNLIEQLQAQPDQAALDDGKERFAAARLAAEQRRKRGAPY